MPSPSERFRTSPYLARNAPEAGLENPFSELTSALKQLVETSAQIERAMEARCFRFYLAEKEYDTSPPIATGILFEDGTVALRFYTKSRTRALSDTALYHSLKELLFKHGHQGKRAIQWIDGPPLEDES